MGEVTQGVSGSSSPEAPCQFSKAIGSQRQAWTGMYLRRAGTTEPRAL